MQASFVKRRYLPVSLRLCPDAIQTIPLKFEKCPGNPPPPQFPFKNNCAESQTEKRARCLKQPYRPWRVFLNSNFMKRFEVIVRLKVSDRPDYENLHRIMNNLGFSQFSERGGKFVGYTYVGECSADEVLKMASNAITSIHERFAIFVHDLENGKSAGSVN